MTKRSAVYEVLDGERAYQDEKWGSSGTHGQHSITEFLVYIRDYTEEAMHIVTREKDEVSDPKGLDIVRKIGALAVACLEQHGAPRRNIPYKIVGRFRTTGGVGQGGL